MNPFKNSITANVLIPGSKSYTNRALIMAALTKGPVCLKAPLYSDDTRAMIGCLRTLGIQIETDKDQLIVHGDVSAVQNIMYNLYVHDSGTTARFMLALLCIIPGTKIIEGSEHLNKRPISDLVDSLRSLGATIDYCHQEGTFPIKVSSSSLNKSVVHLKSDISSQFCSALLLISPYLFNGLTIHTTQKTISKPYLDMTLNCMQDWGIDVIKKERSYFTSQQPYKKDHYTIEGDFSSASYFFAIAALTKSTITVENLNPSSMQADRRFLEILEKMGNNISYGKSSICIHGKSVTPLHIDMEDCPDQVMTVAVLAAFAPGITHITGVRSLRDKETERILAVKNELKKMGIHTEDTHDTLTIYGGTPYSAEIDTYNDHRIAMAFAVAATKLEGLVIRHPEVVNKTFPNFWEILEDIHKV